VKRREREAVVTTLIDELDKRGSWCGETHVQKAMFFVQEMAEVDLGFDFILYKHGPFSFDLRDELTAMRADLLLDLEVRALGYGPRLRPMKNAWAMVKRYRDTVERVRPRIQFVAERFGDRPVTELERLGTALYVARRKKPGETPETQAQEIHRLKPHVSVEQAREALQTVRSWEAELPS
jgi:hypothetical protein